METDRRQTWSRFVKKKARVRQVMLDKWFPTNIFVNTCVYKLIIIIIIIAILLIVIIAVLLIATIAILLICNVNVD